MLESAKKILPYYNLVPGYKDHRAPARLPGLTGTLSGTWSIPQQLCWHRPVPEKGYLSDNNQSKMY